VLPILLADCQIPGFLRDRSTPIFEISETTLTRFNGHCGRWASTILSSGRASSIRLTVPARKIETMRPTAAAVDEIIGTALEKNMKAPH
jgi:hypothetical protein